MNIEYDSKNNTIDLCGDDGYAITWIHAVGPSWFIRWRVSRMIAKYLAKKRLALELSKEIGV